MSSFCQSLAPPYFKYNNIYFPCKYKCFDIEKKICTIKIILSLTKLIMLFVIWGIVFVLILLVIAYNKLVRLKNNVENAFADIDVQLKNRFDLVENLVSTVKGYAKHEKEVLEGVTNARTSFMDAKDTQGKMEADNMLTWALKSLFAVAENYPDLKANQNFLQLQQELSDLENKIASARRYYNSAIREYDNALEAFPSNIIAGMFNFKKMKNYFEASTEEKAVPKVSFDTEHNKK